ncbi:proline-rich nuclear receptor coactivator 2-like [Chelonus insularis]|uniref:proline-rich nuclear receptor coactivator 2-like n=1 Tax=Chelonus insularis TaxID=460826 RepID=UPI0015886B6A|nr:proline-rich nuclear receptor coactivator 2-like [Chelonus insularis]
MTNSTPKMNNKVARQGSPNTGGKRSQYRNGTIKSTTYFSSNSRQVKYNSGRLSCSPGCGKNSGQLRTDYSGNGSPTNSFYAGAKFSEPPSPASLPKPPSHWTSRLINSCQRSQNYCAISNHLKMILNVQA